MALEPDCLNVSCNSTSQLLSVTVAKVFNSLYLSLGLCKVRVLIVLPPGYAE